MEECRASPRHIPSPAPGPPTPTSVCLAGAAGQGAGGAWARPASLRGAFRRAHVCEGRKGRSNSEEEQLSAHQVGNYIALRMCCLCGGLLGELRCGQWPDGYRLPGVSWSSSLDAAQLGAGGFK